MTAAQVYKHAYSVCVIVGGVPVGLWDITVHVSILKEKDTDSIWEEMTTHASFISYWHISLPLALLTSLSPWHRTLTGEEGAVILQKVNNLIRLIQYTHTHTHTLDAHRKRRKREGNEKPIYNTAEQKETKNIEDVKMDTNKRL